jgi:hypothetical protein
MKIVILESAQHSIDKNENVCKTMTIELNKKSNIL